jgi:hypothetical protein
MWRTWVIGAEALVLLCGGARVSAGQTDQVPEFNTIRTPASPAFVLLGVEPTSVARPSTAADFAASLVDASDNFSSLPKNYALEASPYWLLRHPRQGWRSDVRRNVLQSLQRTFSFSAATAQIGTDAAPITGVAFSGRASILSGRLSKETVERIERIDSLLPLDQAELLASISAGAAAVDTLSGAALFQATTAEEQGRIATDNTLILAGVTAAKDGLTAGDAETAVSNATAAVDRQLERAQAGAQAPEARRAATRIRAALQEAQVAATDKAAEPPVRARLREALQDFVAAREGWFIEVAGGASWRAPSGVFDSTSLGRWGTWLTVSYLVPDVSFLAVARYLDSGVGNGDDIFDVGGRVVYTRDMYAVSLEYVDRHLIHSPSTVRPWKLAGVVDYKVSPAVWLTGSFGRDFESDSPGSLLARLGVSLQLSKERYGLDRALPTK